MRLKGQGLPNGKGEAGDLYVRPKALIPRQVSGEEKDLYTKLRSLSQK
jgi:curved DNA-binding protein